VGGKFVKCEPEFGEHASAFGEFANAIRVVADSDLECFVDFCVYNAQENKALVVSRVRVRRDFIEIIINSLKPLVPVAPQFTVQDNLLTTPEGQLILMKVSDDEQ